jgi:glycosyltransferase involved in cell wall biosynthesis
MYKICLISNLYPSNEDPSYGSFVEQSYNQLKGMGFLLREPVVIKGRLKPVRKTLAYIKFVITGLWSLIIEKNDLYYFHYLTYSTLCLIPVLPFKKVKFVVNIHGDDLVGNRPIHKIMGVATPYILRKAEKIVVPSSYFKSTVKKMYPHVLDEKIIISPSSGFNENIFFPHNAKMTDRNPIHFGYVSRVDEGKGWEDLLRASQILKSENPELFKNFKLSVYGSGNEVEKLVESINQMDLADKIQYHAAVPHEKLGDIFRSFDYFIFPTLRESLGLVAIEALACGTPVICSDIKPLTEYVVQGQNGFYFKVNSPIDLYNIIKDCFSVSQVSYQTLAENAKYSVEEFESKRVMLKLQTELLSIF